MRAVIATDVASDLQLTVSAESDTAGPNSVIQVKGIVV